MGKVTIVPPATRGGKGHFAKGTAPGPGRAPGTPNSVTKQLREMIAGALDDAGGQDYLVMQAFLNPGPFLALVGKILPTRIIGDDSEPPVQIAVIQRTYVDAPKKKK